MGGPRALGVFPSLLLRPQGSRENVKFCLEFPNESLLVVRLRLQAAQKASAVRYTVCTEANEVCCMP